MERKISTIGVFLDNADNHAAASVGTFSQTERLPRWVLMISEVAATETADAHIKTTTKKHVSTRFFLLF